MVDAEFGNDRFYCCEVCVSHCQATLITCSVNKGYPSCLFLVVSCTGRTSQITHKQKNIRHLACKTDDSERACYVCSDRIYLPVLWFKQTDLSRDIGIPTFYPISALSLIRLLGAVSKRLVLSAVVSSLTGFRFLLLPTRDNLVN